MQLILLKSPFCKFSSSNSQSQIASKFYSYQLKRALAFAFLFGLLIIQVPRLRKLSHIRKFQNVKSPLTQCQTLA
ncbi:hypothetical protein CUMW_129130 [Citrus unshiu]|nr:hypothetical protein CUMW_129130 [Citrus unshiu]